MCFSRTVQRLRQLGGALAAREVRRFVFKTVQMPFELQVRVMCVRPPNSRSQIVKNNMACCSKDFTGTSE